MKSEDLKKIVNATKESGKVIVATGDVHHFYKEDKKVDGITDLRDESNREGMRIVIELRRDVNANVLLNKLYHY